MESAFMSTSMTPNDVLMESAKVKTGTLCKYYSANGWCRHGNSCRFKHCGNPSGATPGDFHQPPPLPVRYDSYNTDGFIGVPTCEETADVGLSSSNRLSRYGPGVNHSFRLFKRSTDHFIRAGLSALAAATPHHHHHHHHHHPHHRHNRDYKDGIQPQQRKQCSYFAEGYCRNGDRCYYAHDQQNRVTSTDEVSGASGIEARWEARLKRHQDIVQSRLPVAKPTGSLFLAELTERQLTEFRMIEIEQLKKRFPGVLIEENCSSSREIFVVPLASTDPDWPYDVKMVLLKITFLVDYPKSCAVAEVSENHNKELPLLLSKHLTRSVQAWLNDRHTSNVSSGKTELMFRPFLRWFDRNMEELFTEGLRTAKRDMDAEAAGIKFVPFDELFGPSDKKDDQLSSDEYLDDDDDDSDEDDTGDDDMEYGNLNQEKHLTQTLYPNLEKLSLLETDDRRVIKQQAAVDSVQPVIVDLAKKKSSNSCGDSVSQKSKSSYDFRAPKKGTEIVLRNFQQGENVASVICQKIHIVVQCRRCKTNHDVITDPKRRKFVPCKKCHGDQVIAFRPNLMHQFSSVLGYLDLDGCSAFDLPIVDCLFTVECLTCNKPMRSDGINYGQMWTACCHTCNSKLTMFADSAKFHVLHSNKDKKLLEKKDKRSKTESGAVVQEGRPLPNNGTCRHYRKSYRWFRFPCCGKCYPCDICHNDKENEHEIKFATRILCGFCAKEQPFSSKTPCVVCGSNFNHVGKGHWEGGRGCRDKTRMSREDSHKYSGIGKTISRKTKEAHEKGKKKSQLLNPN